MSRFSAVILLLLSAMPAFAAPAKDYTEVRLVVTDTEKGTPIPKAAITLNFVRGKNILMKKDRAQWDVKTDSKGTVTVPYIPRGKMKVLVYAKGYQTFGDEFEIAGDEQTIEVKLAVPHGQYSVHDGEIKPAAEEKKKP